MFHSIHRSFVTLSLFVLFTGLAWAAAPTISSTSPATNALNVSATANLTVTFDQSMNNATLTASNIKVHGNYRGFYSAAFAVSGNTVTINPDSSFKAGEVITVSVTTGVQNASNEPMASPRVYNFTVDAPAGYSKFRSPDSYTAYGSINGNHYSVLADLNKDGHIDIATTSSLYNIMSVMMNNGDGTFASAVTYTTLNAFDISAADVDGDGDMDLAVANNNAFGVSVFVNNGSGSFSTRNDYAFTFPQSNAQFLVTVDMDGDGDIDIVANDLTNNYLHVMKNNGSGVFSSSGFDKALTTKFGALAYGDLDKDGDMDIAASAALGDSVEYFDNDGTGNLSLQTRFYWTNTNGVTAVLIADINSAFGSKQDLVYLSGSTNYLTYFRDNGPALFEAAEISVGGYPNALQAMDADSDNDLDLLVANYNDATFSLLTHTGGAYSQTTYPIPNNPDDLSVADLDNDGDMDVVTFNRDAKVSVFMNYNGGHVASISPANGARDQSASSNIVIVFDEHIDSGTLTSSTVKVTGSISGNHAWTLSSYVAGTYTATLNPTVDFVPGEVVSINVTNGVKNSIGVVLQRGYTSQFVIAAGNGAIFGAKTDYSVGTTPKSVILADLNADGAPDFVAVNSGSDNVSVRLNNGDGTFGSEALLSTGVNPSSVAAGDVDGDGDIDLVVTVTGANQLARFLNNGSGVFGSATTYGTSTGPIAIALNDIDGDGDLDAGYSNGQGLRQSNNGSGAFSDEWGFSSTDAGVAIADVDNDGDLDFIGVNENMTLSNILVSYNSGSGVWNTLFSGSNTYSTGHYPTGILVADFSGDAYADVVTSNLDLGNGTISYLQNNQNGTFAAKVDYTVATGAQPQGLAAADIDGDGDLDIVVANGAGDNAKIFINNGSGVFSDGGEYTTGDNPYAIASADVNGDGLMDIATANYGGGSVSVKMNGLTAPIVTTSAATSITSTGATLNGIVNPLNLGTITRFAYKLNSAGAYAATDTVTAAPTGFAGGANTSISAALTGLQQNTIYNFKAIGVNSAGTTEGSVLNFTTLEDALVVSSTTPSANALDVDTASNITVTFNVPVKSDSLNAANVKVNGSFSGPIAGSISYDGPSKTMTFNPTGYFRAGEMVSITLSNRIASNSALSFLTPATYSFTSAATGTGPGFFNTTTVSNHFSKSESRFLSADVDNDGDPDLIGWNYNQGFTVSKNNGSGFAAPVSNSLVSDLSTSEAIKFGDIDGDGYGDIIAARSNSSTYIVILKNNGSGTFSLYDSINTSSTVVYYGLEVKDFNNDGKMDIAYYANGASQFKIAYNSTGWTNTGSYAITAGSYRMTSGDVDNDGDIDLVFADDTQISVFKNNGYETFASAVNYTFSSSLPSTQELKLCDFNGDDYLDAMTTGSSPHQIAINLNNGDGTFGSETLTTLSILPAVGNAGDLDGDGDIDLAFVYQNETVMNVAYNNGSGVFNQQALFNVDMPGLTMMDYDNDGDIDIIGKDYSDNTTLNILVNTTPTAPGTSASGVNVTNDYGSQFKLNWTNGNGNGRIVVMKQGSAVTWTPSDNTTYAANASFSTGTNLGDGSYVVYNGTASNVTVTNLALNTTYHVAVYEFNGLSGMEKYNTVSPGIGSDQTNTTDGYPFDTTAGYALTFNGYWNQTSNALTLGNAFTIEAWIKPASIGSMTMLVHGSNYMWIGMDGTGKFTGKVYDNDPGGDVTVTGTSTAIANRWYHVTLMGSNGTPLKLYVNGVLEATSGGNLVNIEAYNDVFYLGGDYNNSSFVGDLDEIRFWSDLRTESEIRSNMFKTLSGIPDNLVSYWQLNEGSTNNSADIVSSNPMVNYDNLQWIPSGAPVGSAAITTSSIAASNNGPHSVGNISLSMTTPFANPVDVVVSELTAEPSNYPTGYGSSIGGKYFVINLFGNPGTFSTSLTLTYGAGVITTAQHNNPSLLKLYKRESNSSSSWSLVASASTADSVTGQVTWAGITSFSQFVAVSTGNTAAPSFTFTKSNYADWTLPENQDRISGSVWLTRQGGQGIFNIAVQNSYNSSAPQGTEWAAGKVSDGVESLVFDTWNNTTFDNWGDKPNMVGKDMVLHLIDDNTYLDIKFLSWTSGGYGGGFSYTRSFYPLELKADSASGITKTSATISGRIYSKDGAATTRILYGTTSGVYTDSVVVPSSPITAVDSLMPISANLTSLNQGTLYYVVFSADNGTRYGRSGEFSFSTDTALVASVASATNVVSTTVTVNGSVRSSDLTASAQFLYGTSSGVYTDSAAATPGSINADIFTSVSANLTSLTPGTLYYYALAATNSSYYKRSSEGSFITMSSHAGNALAFDGSNDYVTVGNESDFDFTTAVTLEAWIKPSSVTGERGIVTKQSGGAHPYQIRVENGEITFGFYDGTWYPVTTSGANIQVGKWTHVAGTYDMTTAKIYVNGVLAASSNYSFSIPTNNQPLEIGRTNSNYFSGTIDEVRVWNVARTQQQIQDNMRLPFTGAQSGLVGYWQFNASSGSTAQNHGTGSSGTLTNFNNTSSSGWVSSDALIGPLAGAVTGVSNVTGTAASLSGEVFTTGSDASAKFLLGTVSGTYTDSVSATPGTVTQDNATAISASTSGLVQGTLYYVRVASTNSSIYNRSAESSFMTMSGAPGNALRFDGSDDYVNIPDHNSLDLTSTFTLEAWIKPNGFNAMAGIISKYQTSGSEGYFIRLKSSAPYTGLEVNGMSTSDGILSAGNWYHIAAVRSGGIWTLYVNGSSVSLSGSPGTILSNNNFLGIGVDYIEGGRYFNGAIDDVRIWNVARTQQEIQDNMNTPFSSAQSGLVGYWQLNASSGTVAHGHGSDAGNGTLNNFNFDANSGWLESTAPLPVELTSFTAASVRLSAELKWKTATELNNHGYEIERTLVSGEKTTEKTSVTPKNWSKVGFVEGSGNSNAPKEYSFTDKVTRAATYAYRLKLIDRDGKFAYSPEVEVNVGAVPLVFALEQNYPNPFNPATTIGFTLEQPGLTTLKIYDIVGREVATLVNEVLEAGVYHQKQFDARNLASGVYFARLTSSSKVQLKKMMLVK